jgi:preprotein translocase subunit SecA
LKLTNAEQKMLRDDPDAAADLVHDQVEQGIRSQAITRLIGSVERRLDGSLDLNADQLATEDSAQVNAAILDAIRRDYEGRRERLLGNDGQIARDIEQQLARSDGPINESHLLNGLLAMPQGTVTAFDKKTHKRTTQRTSRLNYAYYAASFLEGKAVSAVTDKVLAHLQNAEKALKLIWGASAWESVSKHATSELNEGTREALKAGVGELALQGLNGQTLGTLPPAEQQKAAQALGGRALSEVYRQLLLRVISELWVDYLTRMEALRISVSLEAYAQRDPLVEYKAQAFRMFQTLFDDMRTSVVNRMFTYRPRDPQQAVQAAEGIEAESVAADGAEEQAVPANAGAQPSQASGDGQGKKRRRRRKR